MDDTILENARLARGLPNLLLCSVAALALAACGGGGAGNPGPGPGDPDPGDPGTPPPPDVSTWTPPASWGTPSPDNSSDWFTASQPASSLSMQEYLGHPNVAFVDWNPLGNPPGGHESHPYEVIRLNAAHGVGLSGTGKYVAVVDTGFQLSHEFFQDKNPVTYGNIDSNGYHGTHVASLIAANPNATPMIGVAYNAGLHLSSNSNPGPLAAATLDAAQNYGAVALNNSWGYLLPQDDPVLGLPAGHELMLDDVYNYMASQNVSETQALVGLLGHSNTAWNDLVSAFETFQDTGVIVWALSNDGSQSNADASAGFAELFPQLQGAFITVANSGFAVDSAGNIVDYAFQSAWCGDTAQYCLTADGFTTGAGTGHANPHPSDPSYGQGFGTSYAAPIVAGSVALLAEAFPNLSPEEWANRLLASANQDIPGDWVPSGTTDWGNGYTTEFDEKWGQGVLDLEAALQPIGGVSMLGQGNSVDTARRYGFNTSYLGGGGAFGDSFANALEGTEIAVFDALNGDFYIDASTLARDIGDGVADSAAIPRLDAGGSVDKLDLGAWGLAASDQIAFEELGYSLGFAAVGGSDYIQDALGLSSVNVENASVLSLANDTTAIYGRYDMGFADFEHYGFIGTHDNEIDGALAGVGGAIAFDFDALDLTIGAAQMAEQGGYLGMTASDAFLGGQETAISALSLAASADLTSNLTLFGGIEYGLASGTQGSGYVSALDNATFSGFQVGFEASKLWLDEDRLTFTASQPLRVETGTMSMDIPVGRLPSGEILYDTVTTNLAPSGRQLDLGLSYAFQPNPLGEFEFGVVYSLDAGHVAGQEAAAVGATFTQAF